MVVPAVMLSILALVAIRALMSVVAHDEISPLAPPAADAAAPVWSDEARSLLLPAADDHIDLERAADVEANAS